MAGGAAGARALRTVVRAARAQQRAIFADASAATQRGGAKQRGSGGGGGAGSGRGGKPAVAVDGLFLRRLVTILRICVPSALSREGLLVLVQGALLVSRTLLTDYISRIEGRCGSAITSLVS